MCTSDVCAVVHVQYAVMLTSHHHHSIPWVMSMHTCDDYDYASCALHARLAVNAFMHMYIWHICTYEHIYISLCVYIYICTPEIVYQSAQLALMYIYIWYIWMCVCACVCAWACVYVCIHIRIPEIVYQSAQLAYNECVHTWMNTYIYVMRIYIHIYIPKIVYKYTYVCSYVYTLRCIHTWMH